MEEIGYNCSPAVQVFDFSQGLDVLLEYVLLTGYGEGSHGTACEATGALIVQSSQPSYLVSLASNLMQTRGGINV